MHYSQEGTFPLKHINWHLWTQCPGIDFLAQNSTKQRSTNGMNEKPQLLNKSSESTKFIYSGGGIFFILTARLKPTPR